MDLVAKSDILNKPITPEEAADPEALEAKRQEMLATAQKFATTAAAMLEERTIAANFVDHFQKKDREVDESLEKVRQLEKHWEAKREAGYRIEDYYNAVTFAGGTPNIACRMLQLYLIGPARVWLSDLEENTIFCWLDLKKAFENHFRGTYKRPATTSDLQACIQKKGETSRSFLTRWLATRNECENVDNRTAMHAFIGGLQRGGLLRHKLTCLVNANKLTLDEMINIASDHTAADDDAGGDLAYHTCTNKKNRDNGGSNNKRKNPRRPEGGGSDMVAMTFHAEVQEAEEAADVEAEQAGARPTKSPQPDPAPPNNDPEAGYKRARKHRPRGKGGKGKNKDKEEDSSEAMDEATLRRNPRRANSLGSIKLPVAFGDVNNYREEMITFEVVPFKSSYHVIFGRPTYHKFHARACYIYNKLKIRVLTVGSPYPEITRKLGSEEGEAAFAESVISERSCKATSRGGSGEMRPPRSRSPNRRPRSRPR
ncbi:hypothetical protein QYE76_066116 [Lolium multiflorum]|uniref:Retrotransposon gag domain-containing protein n=1 Tax=Lolium multiflorum TaxID=4521 RepID=A0AAD8SBD5_LOLMU|nr:hypothetical protein QYE76_066116 [Lolium multiflorum]